MDLKLVTRIAMICTALQGLLALGNFLIPSWRYGFDRGPIFSLATLAFYASLALFFYTLFSKQQKG